MARATQLSVCLPNKPGQLAKLTSALAKAKVNVEALSVVDCSEAGVVRLVAKPVAAAKKAAAKLGATVAQEPVLVVKLPHEPGALADAAKRLAAGGVNVKYVYGSADKAGEASTIVFGVDDLDAADEAI